MTFIFLILIVIILLFGISLAKENLEQIEQINASIRQQLEYEKEICRHLNNKS